MNNRSGSSRDFLIDVSRLIWRVWRGQPATGIDRVCLAYLDHFATRSQAVVQRRGSILVLSPAQSDRLFRLISSGPGASRTELLATLVAALPTSRRSPPRPGMVYLNVGHTGLDSVALPKWISRNQVKAVYLIHDLIPLTHPQFCRAGEADKHERRMTNALQSASGIIGNSQDTLGDLARFAESRHLNMPPGTVAWISGYSGTKDVSAISLDRPHFVTIGTIEARKNHLTLLHAWEQLVAQAGVEAPILVIIGNRGWEAQKTIRRLDELGSLAGHVREISSCRDEDLIAWLVGARALLMPSFVEGFGLPIIESLKLGIPVIASNLPVFGEIVGDIPTYLDPADAAGWAQMIKGFTYNSPERRRQLARIGDYRAPTWTAHFRAVEDWLAGI